jgi:3-deoxy-manno-octulosonate cytidylyltransferase (CMP-KDO synthetase)
VLIFAVHPATASGKHPTLTDSSAIAVIPARYASTRLPGKVLIDIAGRPMVEHVYRRAQAASTLDAVMVATDDDRIADAVAGFGGLVERTRDTHRSGTERVAEVAGRLPCGIVVNVQGDEPFIEPSMIEAALAPLVDDPAIVMSTLRGRIDDPAELADPHVVKVVVDQQGDALYFSRQTIPHAPPGVTPTVYKHIGLYVYRRAFLLELASLPPMPLETAESLEQLRALEHGFAIRTVETTGNSLGVDTPEDVERARRALTAGARA